jgi:predicted acylesterase/phospholipase RssA
MAAKGMVNRLSDAMAVVADMPAVHWPNIHVPHGIRAGGGIDSNTPIEAVLDDDPRRDALVFAVNLRNPTGPEPTSIWWHRACRAKTMPRTTTSRRKVCRPDGMPDMPTH